MNKFKRAGLVAVQLLVVLATLTATVITFLHPACVEHMMGEVARGLSAGLLLAGVRVLVVVSRPTMACRPVSCWCRFALSAARHELKCGLVAGYLLGLMVAMWVCWRG
jgi:hypothetical protein